MTDLDTNLAAQPRARWRSAVRVEHLVAPGPRNREHFTNCTCRCTEWWTCPTCGQIADVGSVKGRWDAEAGHTARPFDPVWVRLSCGCEFGDQTLAYPETPPEEPR